MQITEINVGQFGVWQDFHLPLNTDQVNVIYGPNEAGKTTLMRFVGEMLYGFQPALDRADSGGCATSPAWHGTLSAIDQDQRFEVARTVDAQHAAGRVAVTGGSSTDEDHAQRLEELLGGIGPVVFNHVFAMGLHQLQQLATLNDTDASRFLFDLSLGADGQQLLQASQQAAHAVRELWDSSRQTGRLFDVLLEREDCLERFRGHAQQRNQHSEIQRELLRAEEIIGDIKSRQSGLRSQLHGHQFLEAAWKPWKRMRDFEVELNMLGESPEFPERGLERLEQLERELADAEGYRDAARETAADQRQALEQHNDASLTAQCDELQAWVDERAWVEEVQSAVDDARENSRRLQQALEQQLAGLEDGWTVARMRQVDCNPSMGSRLMSAEKDYQVAVSRCRRLRRRCRTIDVDCRRRKQELDDELAQRGCSDIDQALADNDELMRELHDVFRYKLRCLDLRHARDTADERLRLMTARTQLPSWLHPVMWSFSGVGALLLAWGLISGFWISGLAGVAYSLLGLTWLGMHRGLKQHLHGGFAEVADRLRTDAIGWDHDLRNAEAALAELRRRSDSTAAATRPGHVDQTDWTVRREQNQLRSVAQDRLQLERLAELQNQLAEDQSRSAELYEELKFSLDDARQARVLWTELIREIGLPDGQPEQSLTLWQRVFELDQQRRAWKFSEGNYQQQTRTLDWIRGQLENICRSAGRWQTISGQPVELLAVWERELAGFHASREDRQRIQQQQAAAETELAEYQSLLAELQDQHRQLLVEAGVDSREAFEQQALKSLRWEELDELIDAAQRELREVAEAETELAIVEEDLECFDPEHNAEHIEMLELELTSLTDDLSSAHENLGRLKQELQSLESDHNATMTGFELAQNNAEFQQTAAEWCQTRLAAELVERMKANFERQQQPETLRVASQFLNQLTRGRYQSIWSPLGTQRLCVRDDRESIFEVSQLSGGTREQLYLAVRLALVEQLALQGATLPMVLDDVLVNFDHGRTELAVDTLLDFANRGQQQLLIFTCHLHLAHLFESKGIEPVWLPGHQLAQTTRRAG